MPPCTRHRSHPRPKRRSLPGLDRMEPTNRPGPGESPSPTGHSKPAASDPSRRTGPSSPDTPASSSTNTPSPTQPRRPTTHPRSIARAVPHPLDRPGRGTTATRNQSLAPGRASTERSAFALCSQPTVARRSGGAHNTVVRGGCYWVDVVVSVSPDEAVCPPAQSGELPPERSQLSSRSWPAGARIETPVLGRRLAGSASSPPRSIPRRVRQGRRGSRRSRVP